LDRRSVGGELRLSKPECHRDRDEPLLRPVVQVAFDSAPLGVGRLDQTRTRSLQLGQPRAQFRLQARVLERQRSSGTNRPDQLVVLGERRVVDQRRDRLALSFDHGRCSLSSWLRELHGRAAGVDVASARRNPVRELKRGIAECAGERLPQVECGAFSELDHESGDRTARKPPLEQRGQHGDGNRREHELARPRRPFPKRVLEDVVRDREGERREHRAPRPQNGSTRPSLRTGRPTPAAHK
jgi:hypothetical protein